VSTLSRFILLALALPLAGLFTAAPAKADYYWHKHHYHYRWHGHYYDHRDFENGHYRYY